MSPSRSWEPTEYDGIETWDHSDGGGGLEAGVWKENGRWQLSFTPDTQIPFRQVDLGEHETVDDALNRAEVVMDIERLVIPLRDNDHDIER
jgi:hypothetical protein